MILTVHWFNRFRKTVAIVLIYLNTTENMYHFTIATLGTTRIHFCHRVPRIIHVNKKCLELIFSVLKYVLPWSWWHPSSARNLNRRLVVASPFWQMCYGRMVLLRSLQLWMTDGISEIMKSWVEKHARIYEAIGIYPTFNAGLHARFYPSLKTIHIYMGMCSMKCVSVHDGEKSPMVFQRERWNI